MADKRLNARVQLKNDIEANWLKATNFVPLDGEFIVYDVDNTHSKPRFKIGDGKTVVSSLPFSEPDAAGELLGLVKSGGDVTISNGIITVKDDSHAHVIDNIDGLRTELDSKVASVNGKGLSSNDFTTDEKNKLSGIAAGAQVNQNAFSRLIVGQTTMDADNATDTLTLVAGSNIILSADPNADTVTISSVGGDNGIDVDGVIEVLQENSAYFDTEADATGGTSAPLDADTFGGKHPSEYALNTDISSVYVKASVEEFEYGEAPLTKADLAETANKATEANNSAKLENKSINELFTMLFEVEHPVGSLYLSSSNADNPNTKWATFGITCAWELVKDVFLLGAGGNYALGNTGGEATHTLTAAEMPSHGGHLYGTAGNVTGKGNATGVWLGSSNMTINTSQTKSWGWDYGNNEYYPASQSLGSDQSHNNMPPYLATNIWKRIS